MYVDFGERFFLKNYFGHGSEKGNVFERDNFVCDCVSLA